jgi:hypothetical protein
VIEGIQTNGAVKSKSRRGRDFLIDFTLIALGCLLIRVEKDVSF